MSAAASHPDPRHTEALVTGASGFIGGHLLERLRAAGVSAQGLDIRPPQWVATGEQFPEPLLVDLRDREAVERSVAGVRPRTIYHLAAQPSVVVSMLDPEEDIATNVLGTVHLARAAVAAGVERFVFVSTGGALYGEPETVPVVEETVPEPASVYGLSKLSAERYLPLVAPSLPVSVLRPGNVYGPRQDPHGEAGVVAIFARRMLAGEPVTIFGDGSQERDYVYVDDVVRAILLAAEREPATCLVGSGQSTTTLEMFERLAALTGYGHPPVFAAERSGDIQRISLSGAAHRAWGWSPRVDLDVGLRATVEWFRTAG